MWRSIKVKEETKRGDCGGVLKVLRFFDRFFAPVSSKPVQIIHNSAKLVLDRGPTELFWITAKTRR